MTLTLAAVRTIAIPGASAAAGIVEEERAAVRQHPAPVGGARADAEAEERQRGERDEREREGQECVRERDRQDVRPDVAEHDPAVGGPSIRAASTYGRVALLERRAADDPGVERREEDDEQADREEVAAAEHADDDDRDEERRQCVDEVDDCARSTSRPAAAVAGQQAEDVADQHRAERR